MSGIKFNNKAVSDPDAIAALKKLSLDPRFRELFKDSNIDLEEYRILTDRIAEGSTLTPLEKEGFYSLSDGQKPFRRRGGRWIDEYPVRYKDMNPRLLTENRQRIITDPSNFDTQKFATLRSTEPGLYRLAQELYANLSRSGITFDGRVLDVGTRDGRYIPVLEKLGAHSVYGIDPDRESLERAVRSELLSKERAIPAFLKDLPDKLKGTFDCVAFLNYPPETDPNELVRQVEEAMKPGGKAVYTFIERMTAERILEAIGEQFPNRGKGIVDLFPEKEPENYANRYLIIFEKQIEH